MLKRVKKFDLVKRQTSRNQSGLASVVVVSVLVVVLSLIAIGFSRDMDRAVRQSANSSLGTAATYAARSGINDAISYVKANPAASATNCNDLLTDSASSSDNTKILANLSGDGTTKYTCLLINPTPTDLAYQKINSFKSQVVRINPTANLSKLMFSWQAYDQSNPTFPATGSLSLTDETTWGTNKYQPVLRLSLYAIPTAVSGSAALQYLATNPSYKTFFFYPNKVASSSPSVTEINWSSTADGSLKNVNCADVHGATFNTGSFSGSADNNCNVIISSLPSDAGHAPYYFYARITPLYTDASVIIKGNDAANSVLQLINTQAIVDVTAKSGTAVKRLQARVDIASNTGTDVNISSLDDAFPEYAIRTSNTLCKRVQVQNPGSGIRIDPTTKSDCSAGTTIIDEQLPAQPSTGAASSITTNSARLNGTVDPKGADVLTCYFNYGITTGYGSKQNCASLPRAGNGPGTPVYADIGGLAQYTDYHFQLCVTNIANSWDNGVTCDGDQTFKTLALPPTVTITPPSQNIDTGRSATISWNTSPSFSPTTCNLTGNWAGYSTASSGSKTDTFNSPGTYTYTAQCTGPGGVGNTANATVIVTTPPPAPPEISKWVWNGGDRFTYNVRNASRCVVEPDDGGSVPIAPTLNADATLTDGHPNVGAWLRCWNQNVGPKSAHVNAAPPTITVNIGLVGPGWFYNGNNKFSGACHDGVHNYIMCISWTAVQPGGVIDYCNAYGGTYYARQNTPPGIASPTQTQFGYNGSYNQGTGALAPVDNWWNVTQGWNDNPGTVSTTVTCHSATFGNTGSARSPDIRFTQCSDDGRTGRFWPTCDTFVPPSSPPPPAPIPSPPAPTPPPPPYVLYRDCHDHKEYIHWSDGRHQKTATDCDLPYVLYRDCHSHKQYIHWSDGRHQKTATNC